MKHYIGAILCAAAVFLALTNLASAHAQLDHCTPAPGTAVATAPSEVRCWFTEEIDSKTSTLTIADANGARVDNSDGHVDLNDANHKQMFATVKSLATGVYKVTWHTVTPDDNGISDGTFYFGVGQVAVPTNAPVPAAEATLSPGAPAVAQAASETPTTAPTVAATETPAASTPAATAGTTGTVAPTSAGTAGPTGTPAAPASTATSSSSIPVVIILGILEALIIIGVLVFLFRGTPS